MSPKYVFVTGGVCSSLGKGLTAASLGLLLERQGLKVSLLKLDPYLNVDPGTMSPYQHGEVYVTDDGAETDLDLGHYYRFTHSVLTKNSSASAGQVYYSVIKRERHGDYLGKTVQVIPHITDEIKQRIVNAGKQVPGIDVVIVEIGGTVGDIESQPFLEAIRQFRNERKTDCLNIHLTYVPFIKAAGETKTKPTQHSVQMLLQIGLSADLLICRSEKPLPEDVKEKISLFCNVPKQCVIEEVDVANSIYEVPLQLKSQNTDKIVCDLLRLNYQETDLKDWEKLLEKKMSPIGEITVGIVGKYVQHKDAYKSILEALEHAAITKQYRLNLRFFEADKVADSPDIETSIGGCDGYLIPGGFGERGWNGKLMTATYAREHKIPYFGICLGMQVMAVEFARSVLKLLDANTTEIDPTTKNPVICLLDEQKSVKDAGGTMRLGAYECDLVRDSLAYKAYGAARISERHRHRYEFNNRYKADMEAAGFRVAGTLKGADLCEVAEVKNHPWMVGVQFHPEFKSRLVEPHPLFLGFVQAMIDHKTSEKSEVGRERKTLSST